MATGAASSYMLQLVRTAQKSSVVTDRMMNTCGGGVAASLCGWATGREYLIELFMGQRNRSFSPMKRVIIIIRPTAK
eukprot:9492725-Pyramimonas_sp.AAC.1